MMKINNMTIAVAAISAYFEFCHFIKTMANTIGNIELENLLTSNSPAAYRK